MATSAALTVLGQKKMERWQRKENQSPSSTPGLQGHCFLWRWLLPCTPQPSAGSSCTLLRIKDSVFLLHLSRPATSHPEESVTKRHSSRGTSGAMGKETEHTHSWWQGHILETQPLPMRGYILKEKGLRLVSLCPDWDSCSLLMAEIWGFLFQDHLPCFICFLGVQKERGYWS